MALQPDGERLRVALVCPYSLSRPGGVQGQVAGLARAYRARGHEVAVLAPVDGPVEVPAGVRLVAAGASVRLPANGSLAPVSRSPLAVRRALGELRGWSPDVVHVHEPFAPGASLGSVLARRAPPKVATFHRSGAGRPYRSLRPLLRPLGRRLAARCAVSPSAKSTALAVVDGDIEVLFNGVECDRVAASEPWPSDRPAVLFLGRHEPRKGLAVLLDAFDRLRGRAELGSPELWVAGEGPQTAELRRRWPPDDDVRWLGVVPEDEKRRRLVAASVLCAPSLGRESFGLVLLEAMAARTVVVASDIDGYREASGGRAVLVPPGRPTELADALAGVLDGRLAIAEPPGHGALGVGPSGGGERPAGEGRAGWLDLAEARAGTFSMARLAESYEAVFRRVLGGRPRGLS